MKFIAIIPARYASTRFPAKPLAMLGGKPVIQHVYERVTKVLDAVVATDDERIYDVVKAFGGRVVMTSTEHRTGTDRCLEAYNNYGIDALESGGRWMLGASEPLCREWGTGPHMQASPCWATLNCLV